MPGTWIRQRRIYKIMFSWCFSVKTFIMFPFVCSTVTLPFLSKVQLFFFLGFLNFLPGLEIVRTFPHCLICNFDSFLVSVFYCCHVFLTSFVPFCLSLKPYTLTSNEPSLPHPNQKFFLYCLQLEPITTIQNPFTINHLGLFPWIVTLFAA